MWVTKKSLVFIGNMLEWFPRVHRKGRTEVVVWIDIFWVIVGWGDTRDVVVLVSSRGKGFPLVLKIEGGDINAVCD